MGDESKQDGRNDEGETGCAVLVELQGTPFNRLLELTPGRHILGRDPMGQLVFAEERISRRHAVVYVEGGVVSVEDLSSVNGTLVGDHLLQKGERRVLLSGDEVRLGRECVVLRYYAPGEVRKEGHLSRFLQQTRDPVSGFAQAEWFNWQTEMAIHRKLVSRNPLSVLACEFRGLEELERRFGEGASDEWVKELSRNIRGLLPGSELPGRLGHARFGILMEGYNIREALDVAGELKRQLDSLMVPWQGEFMVLPGAIGVAGVRQGVSEIAVLMDRLQLALQDAWQQGPNAVSYFSELAAKEKICRLSLGDLSAPRDVQTRRMGRSLA
ncbi:MAG: FHA domain-containing protein [Magnetococcales bacterium]|nr:FHA domain-containing protein [Magnetococcales bacterium]